jgi:UDP-glucuronate decarboxylase
MHPNDGRVVSNFIVQALTGRALTVYGDGSQTRSFCYVDDLVEGLVRMMNTEGDVCRPVNLGSPHEVSIVELADRIIGLTGSRVDIDCRELPADDPTQRCPDITRARTLFDWEPRVPLESGLERTIAYFRKLIEEQAVVAA